MPPLDGSARSRLACVAHERLPDRGVVEREAPRGRIRHRSGRRDRHRTAHGCLPHDAASSRAIVELLRATPPIAIVPAFIVVLGFGDSMRIGVIAFGVCFPVLVNTFEGVRAVSPEVRDTASMLHVGGAERLLRIYLPAALPSIMAGLRIAISIGLVLVVVSEFVGEGGGLGHYILDQQAAVQRPGDVRRHPLPRPPRVRAQPALPPRRATGARVALRGSRRPCPLTPRSRASLRSNESRSSVCRDSRSATRRTGLPSRGVTFDVSEGELLAIVGASGCGKTTLLRLLCGLMPADRGHRAARRPAGRRTAARSRQSSSRTTAARSSPG